MTTIHETELLTRLVHPLDPPEQILTVPVTDPQASALECRADGGLDPIVHNAWSGGILRFHLDDRDDLFSALIDACNAEDAQHQIQRDPFAGRACRCLGNLASKVLMAGRERDGEVGR